MSEEKQRRSIRLPGYDYSAPGFYFVTICTKDRICIFGEIENRIVKLSEMGQQAEKYWQEIPAHFPDIHLWEYVIMPNHIHGVLEIRKKTGVQNFEPLSVHKFQHILRNSLGSIIRAYKSALTKWARENTEIWIPWQRNFHDQIIRNQAEFRRIQQYIRNNPLRWDQNEAKKH